MVDNPTYSPSLEQLRSPLYFTNLIASGELVSSLGLHNPQNSPESSQHPTPPYLQTPPTTTFFSAFTSRLERAVQQITSPHRERQSIENIEIVVPNIIEFQNLSNSETPFEFSNFWGDKSIRNLFPTPSLFLPIDLSYPTIDEQFNGFLAIARPIEEALVTPLNQSFLNTSPLIPLHLINQVPLETEIESIDLYLVEGIEQFHSPEIESQTVKVQVNNNKNQVENEGISVRGVDVLPVGSSLPPIIISDTRDENVIRGGLNTSRQRSPSNPSSSSSSDPPTPSSLLIQNLKELAQMAQPQRLLNIALFPYFYGRLGDDPDAYVDRFQIVATANELPQNKYFISFPGNLIGNAGEWYATLDP